MSEPDPVRSKVQELASESLKRGDATGWFDQLYRSADGAEQAIPWARMEPNVHLGAWLDRERVEGRGEGRWWSAAGWEMTRRSSHAAGST